MTGRWMLGACVALGGVELVVRVRDFWVDRFEMIIVTEAGRNDGLCDGIDEVDEAVNVLAMRADYDRAGSSRRATWPARTARRTGDLTGQGGVDRPDGEPLRASLWSIRGKDTAPRLDLAARRSILAEDLAPGLDPAARRSIRHEDAAPRLDPAPTRHLASHGRVRLAEAETAWWWKRSDWSEETGAS